MFRSALAALVVLAFTAVVPALANPVAYDPAGPRPAGSSITATSAAGIGGEASGLELEDSTLAQIFATNATKSAEGEKHGEVTVNLDSDGDSMAFKQVSSPPQPTSLLLLGTCVLGAAGMLRMVAQQRSCSRARGSHSSSGVWQPSRA